LSEKNLLERGISCASSGATFTKKYKTISNLWQQYIFITLLKTNALAAKMVSQIRKTNPQKASK